MTDIVTRLTERSTAIQTIMDRNKVRQGLDYAAQAKNRMAGPDYKRRIEDRRKK
jgi:hypothetical protein